MTNEKKISFLKDESGQVMAEWIILAVFLIAGLWATFEYFPELLGSNYRSMTGLIMLPIP